MNRLFREFEASAQQAPGIIAVRDGVTSISYDELNVKSKQFATELGLRKGSVVALLLPSGCPWVLSVLACLYSSCIYCTISTYTPKRRIHKLIEELGADVLVTDQYFLSDNFSLCQRQVALEVGTGQKIFVHVSTLKNSNCIAFPKKRVPTPVCVIATSGSTGVPKLVLLSEQNILEHVYRISEMIGFVEEENFLLACSPAFSMALTALYCALLNGKTLSLMSQDSILSPSESLKYISEYNVTFIKTVPVYFEELLKWMVKHPIDLPALRVVNLSGAPIKSLLVESALDALPGVRLISTYGSTEAFSSTFFDSRFSKTKSSHHTLPVGAPFKGTKIHQLLSIEDGLFEIGISGKNLMIGYVSKGAIAPVESIYPTGDLGRYDDNGDLVVVGRKDSLIKWKGFRISLSEIEFFVEEIEGVTAAVAKIDCSNGVDNLVCYVVCVAQVTADYIRKELELRLPSYSIPRKFIRCTRFPMLENGKIARQSLNSECGSEVPVKESLSTTRVLFKHEDREFREISKKVIDAWTNILGTKDIFYSSGFQDQGGDSLKLMELHTTLETSFDVNLTMSTTLNDLLKEFYDKTNQRNNQDCDYFDYDFSVIPVTKNCDFTSSAKWTDLISESNFQPVLNCSYDLTYAQKLSLYSNPNRNEFFTYVRLVFRSVVDLSALAKSLEIVLNRNPALRSTIESNFAQKEWDFHGVLSLPVLEHPALVTNALELMNIPLDLKKPPNFRWAIVEQEAGSVFVWQISHMFADLYSVDRITKQLIYCYDRVSQGKLVDRFIGSKSVREYIGGINSLTSSNQLVEEMEEYSSVVNDVLCKMAPYLAPNSSGDLILQNRYRPDLSPAKIIHSYALAASEWLNLDSIPIRIGVDGRRYPNCDNQFDDLVGQINDHYCLTFRTKGYSKITEDEIEKTLNAYRTQAINFDRAILKLITDNEITAKRISHVFACAPLGTLTSYSNAETPIESIPRSHWELDTFHKFSNSKGVKVGLYMSIHKGVNQIRLHHYGLSKDSFLRFCRCVEKHFQLYEVTAGHAEIS